MELTKYAQLVKTQLAFELAKQGSSLEEFETALRNINTGEGVYKVAEASKGMLFGIPQMAMNTSLAGGAMAGLTMDEMDKSVNSVNSALDREREKIKLVRRLTHNLKREHGLI
jgi:hypothetical protein